MKFGGTSVADMSKINAVANIIKYELSKGNEIIVVVSAMAGQTNDLTKKVESIGPYMTHVNTQRSYLQEKTLHLAY